MIEQERRQGFCADSLARCRSDNPVTLNGRPALIRGAFQPFAFVEQEREGIGCEFSWQAIAVVMAKGGAFKS
jgi:hypothetical protein